MNARQWRYLLTLPANSPQGNSMGEANRKLEVDPAHADYYLFIIILFLCLDKEMSETMTQHGTGCLV